MRTFIYVGIVQADGLRIVQRNPLQLRRERRVDFRQPAPGEIGQRGNTEHLAGCRVSGEKLLVQVEHDHAHRRGVDQQVEEVVLLAEMQALVFQLFHHLIEDVDDAVRLCLPDTTQTGTEVLLFQQLHTVTDDMERFDDAAVENSQIDNRQHDNAFHNEKHLGRIGIEGMPGEYRQH